MEKLNVKVKYFNENLPGLKFIGGKSNWVDLRAAETVEISKGEFKLIPLGIAMEIPEGYEAHIAPRSSTFKNYGLLQTNSVGIVDTSYCGNEDQWFMPVYATRDTAIEEGDRVCQFRLVKRMEDTIFITVDKLEGLDRGGHGSTGVK